MCVAVVVIVAAVEVAVLPLSVHSLLHRVWLRLAGGECTLLPALRAAVSRPSLSVNPTCYARLSTSAARLASADRARATAAVATAVATAGQEEERGEREECIHAKKEELVVRHERTHGER